jgi:two-component system chemotaxis sensor kinase CheA
MHLVRNAIDHGIESPEGRRAAGKPPAGRLTLAFHRDRDLIVATLTDDGQGLDPDKLRQTAQQRGLMPAQALAALSDAAALRLIFLPGFSTAATVTELSGRGVGMDAVQAAVAKLRGAVEIVSARGQGATFRLTLPAHTLTTQLLVIEAGGDRYGVALDQIVETVGLAGLNQVPIGTGTACVLHGRTVPVLDLAALLGSMAPGDVPRDGKLIVVQAGAEPVGLRVDAIGERIDALVRPPGGMLALIPGVIGSALLGDGTVLLVLDLAGLAS